MKFKLLVLSLLVATTAQVNAAEKSWEFGLAAYLWSSGVDGTVGLGPIDADVDADFKDIVAELDRVIMLRGKADQEKWGLFWITSTCAWILMQATCCSAR